MTIDAMGKIGIQDRQAQPVNTPVAQTPTMEQAANGQVGAVAQPEAFSEGGGADVLARNKAEAKVMQDKLKQACQTCKNRMYQDGSNDPGVSFKSAANIDPDIAASVVLGHEMEHVAHEQAKAKQTGGKIISQSVVLHSAICAECGRSYIAGGTTRTTTLHQKQASSFAVGTQTGKQSGGAVNQLA